MYWPIVFYVLVVGYAEGQLTAQTSIAPHLRECYSDPRLLDRNNLPPMSMAVLIDIIQKIEDNPNVALDLRQLAVLLLHTYRQDGIEFHQPGPTVLPSSTVIPFAPTFHSFYRHRVLLTRVIPANQQVLENDVVNSQLKCALHHMLSTTVDARIRGNENQCNRLSQNRALRTARHIPQRFITNDVEMMALSQPNPTGNNRQRRQSNPNEQVEYTNSYGAHSERQVQGGSTCPLAGGVVYTQWGAVSAGNIIAGVAAGANMQGIPVSDLAQGSTINDQDSQRIVTSIYPATLSGDLAEVALFQGKGAGINLVSVGAAGNWNTTQAPRFHMLTSRENLQMTDPEIRGGVDGFALGSSLSSVLTTSSALKLSQLIDMYYAPMNGVFHPIFRACNRRSMMHDHFLSNNLFTETFGFALALDTHIQWQGTVTGGIDQWVANAVNDFRTYASNNLRDPDCDSAETNAFDFRPKINLYIVLDSAWEYNAVYPAISYLLDNIEVSKFGSSITLLSALDGSVVVNTTFSLADFHSEYTLEKHQSMSRGVNMESTLTNIRIMMHNQLNEERVTNYIGGHSSVLLFLLNSDVQSNPTVVEQARILHETVPDMLILFATSTNQRDNIWNLVRDGDQDIRIVSLNSEASNIVLTMSPTLIRIIFVNRRIVNSNCGSTFPSEATSGTRQFDDFVSPGYTNFYSISPNYFFGNNANSRVRISRTSGGLGNLVVCHSRVISRPRQNGTEDNTMVCQTLTGSGTIEISLQNACEGHSTINSCPSFHISVQSAVSGTPTLTTTCPDCRFPFDIRYQVQIHQLGCFSAASNIGMSVFLLLAAFSFQLLQI